MLRWNPKIPLILGVFLTAGFLAAAETAPPSRNLTITSKSMTVKNLEHQAIFEGDVVMTKEDVVITADFAEVTFASPHAPNEASTSVPGLLSSDSQFDQNAVVLIHAVGNVVFRQADRLARSQEADYYHQEDRVILSGEPVVWEKDYQVTGTKMTIFLRENRSVIEGSKVLIHPRDEVPN